jgi:hypothetical protein
MTELKVIDEYISHGNLEESVRKAYSHNFKNLGFLLGKIFNFSDEYLSSCESLCDNAFTLVSLHCNWLPAGELCSLWNKMSKGDYTWNKIKIIQDTSRAKYHVIINSTTEKLDFSKSILFQMEPNMKNNQSQWTNFWANPDPDIFLRVFTHENSFNNCEWHLSSTYTQLKERPEKNPDLSGIISTVLSSKYQDPGHKKRVDFAKFLDTKDDITLHVFGYDLGYKHYKGSLPYHDKNDALMPYFYTFNVENQNVPNYFTEKIIDAILSECLIFYHGSKNIRDYFDERAFVYLPLEDFEADYALIKKVISEDWRTLRLPYIRNEKQKILETMQFFPRLEKIIEKIQENKIIENK